MHTWWVLYRLSHLPSPSILYFCCTIWWLLTKVCTWKITIPVKDGAMPAPPGNPSKHSVANPSSEAAEGNSWSELCYYRLVWLLLEYFVGRAIMDARLLSDLSGVVVFRVPVTWMYQWFNPLSCWEAFRCAYHVLFTRSLVDRHLSGLVPAFDCLDKVLWTFVYKSLFWQLFSFPLGKCLVIELPGHLMRIMIDFIRNQH